MPPFEEKPKVVIPRAKEVREASTSKPAVPASTSGTVVPITPKASVPATAETNKQYRDRYLAPQTIAGTEVKFTKNGEFVHSNNESQKIHEDQRFIVLADQTLAGWIKWNGKGVAPDKHTGLYYDETYRLPEREELGDLDPAKWELAPNGIDKKDPWEKLWHVVLQDVMTSELFTFVTNSKTGHTAVSNLMRHYNRLRVRKADHYPIVKLVAGGYQHKDSRIGWIVTPSFVAMGSAPCDEAATPPSDPPFNDELPPNMAG
jgi:hypothetical protein